MGELNISDCVVYGDIVYCVKTDGTFATVQLKDIEPQECPNYVIKELYRRLLEKKDT
jgi:hypothetical protein